MSGKHQRRMWTLPAPTGNVSRYNRMQIGIGRGISSNVLIEHDMLVKTLLNYLFEQDTFIKSLTNVEILTDTSIFVSVSFNYEVNHDTLIKILKNFTINHDTSIRVNGPSPISTQSFGGGISKAPIGSSKKKKRTKKPADEIIKLNKLNISDLRSKKHIKIRLDSILEIKLKVGDVESITERDVQNLLISNIDFINELDNRPIEIDIINVGRKESNDYDRS